jgi:HAE1 family hydrophobic/amphiphilic exporter-1
MTSASTDGIATITMQFSLDRSIDAAAQDVQSAIAAAARSLPSSMPNPPTQRKVNPADAPILNIVLSSATMPLSTVDDYAENLLAQQISTITGVAQVAVYGSQQYAVRIQLDPNALATRGLALTDVEQAVSNSNVNLPTGTLYGRDKATSVQATGQLMNAAAYAPMIVAYRNGAPVRLNELGRVFDSVQNDKIAAWYNGTRCSASREPTRSRSLTRSERFFRPSNRNCRRRSSSTSSMTALCRSAPRCTTCRCRCCWRWFWSSP